ncbi:MAG: phosphoribosyltransferase family protein [Planctomycetota bacterium]
MISPLQQCQSVVEGVVPLLFPSICGLCGELCESGSDVFCRSCNAALNQTTAQFRDACRGCGIPWHGMRPRDPIGIQAPCPACRRAESNSGSPSSYAGVIAWARYDNAVKDAIVAAKYPRNAAITRELGRRLSERCEEVAETMISASVNEPALGLPTRPWDMVTSVPSRPWRRIRRGGSGARVLGEAVAAQLGLPHWPWLRAVRRTHKQAWLDDSERIGNVAGAFAPSTPFRWRWMESRPAGRWSGRRVLLVDDVMTTGATAAEISRVLLNAGAASIWVAVVARAVPTSS